MPGLNNLIRQGDVNANDDKDIFGGKLVVIHGILLPVL
jgi:hypothetical protein